MAGNEFDTLEGQLEITTRPATLCYGKPMDFLARLVEILTVKFPVRRDQRLLVLGHQTPTPDDQTTVWARFDTVGNPLGWFGFVKGKWERFYTPARGEIRWIVGNSGDPPAGWKPLVSTADGVSQAVIDRLVPNYAPGPSGTYSLYAARYIGY